MMGLAQAKESIKANVQMLPPRDVLETIADSDEVQCIVLDPWYNRGVGGTRDDYDDWLESVIVAACNKSQHVFVWGFPEIVANQIARIPSGYSLVAWLTWYYKNCPSVIRGWRSAQNTCLHIAAENSTVYAEHFLNAEQKQRWESGKLRFIPGPPSVLEAPLNIGFVGRQEQTGHPAQKPLSVIKPLILMSTREGDTVLDPMCGSGTTGEACLLTGRNSILCDHSAEYISLSKARISKYLEIHGGERS